MGPASGYVDSAARRVFPGQSIIGRLAGFLRFYCASQSAETQFFPSVSHSRRPRAHTHTCSRNSKWRHNGGCNSRLIIARFPLRINRKQKLPIALITIVVYIRQGRNSHTRASRECRVEPTFDVRRVWPTRLRKRSTVTCSKHVTFRGVVKFCETNVFFRRCHAEYRRNLEIR